ncbi:YxeA family protein [Latilactobacillus curvatus]|nr:hypothetical protein CGZ47_05525 [Latilactobacillus curvatus]MCT2880350.1 YxeA family protein [Latilactobacillus curvatus]
MLKQHTNTGHNKHMAITFYRQPAYRADGSHYEVVFQAPRALKPNHYLKLDAKGRFVNSWTVVSKSELPVKLQSSL